MMSQDQAKIQQSIVLLQEVLAKTGLGSNSPSSQQAHKPTQSFPEFQQMFKQFNAKGLEIGGVIAQMTTAAVSMFGLTSNFVRHSQVCKKPEESLLIKVQEALKGFGGPVMALENQQQWKHHAKAVKEMINASFWIFSPQPEFVFAGAIEGSEFNANRFRVNKVQSHNDWYNLLINSIKVLKKEVINKYSAGITYNINGTGSWKDLFSGQPPSQTVQSQPTQIPQAVTQQQAVTQPSVKKAPLKENKQGNWYIQNFEGQTIELSAEEAQMRTSVYIENCKKTIVKIEKSKIKSIMLNNCDDVFLIVKDCVSGVEIMNAKNVRVQILGVSPSISIDKSEQIQIILNGQNKETDILSSKVAQLNITYVLPGGQDLAKDHPVSEQIVTRWNSKAGKFESKVYDTFI